MDLDPSWLGFLRAINETLVPPIKYYLKLIKKRGG
jgi:hypothetical protein